MATSVAVVGKGIDEFPVEILGKIHGLVLQDCARCSHFFHLVQMSSVSKYWRALILGNTILWADVHLSVGLCNGPDIANLYLIRSQTRPLNLFLTDMPPVPQPQALPRMYRGRPRVRPDSRGSEDCAIQLFRRLFDILIAESERWHSLNFDFPNFSKLFGSMVQMLHTVPMPNVKHIVCLPKECPIDVFMGRHPRRGVKWQTPALTSLRIRSLVPFDTPDSFPLSILTALEIDGHALTFRGGRGVEWHKLRQMLTHCHRLERLKLRLHLAESLGEPENRRIRILDLPALRALDISNTRNLSAHFFQEVSCPKLERLRVSELAPASCIHMQYPELRKIEFCYVTSPFTGKGATVQDMHALLSACNCVEHVVIVTRVAEELEGVIDFLIECTLDFQGHPDPVLQDLGSLAIKHPRARELGGWPIQQFLAARNGSGRPVKTLYLMSDGAGVLQHLRQLVELIEGEPPEDELDLWMDV